MSKLFGDRAFYRRTLSLAVPVMIQNAITNFVGLLDNIMVSRVSTEAMTGVSIANTLMFVFNICIFGAVSGAGIFSAQYYGKGDMKGVRYTFRFKIISCVVICAAAIGLFLACGDSLLSMYIESDSSKLDTALVLAEGSKYLVIMLAGLIPFAIVQAYASTLRESGETKLPMIASVSAIFVNLILNYILIFGKLGFPVMGVKGAAIATVISRLVELLIVVVVATRRKIDFPYLKGAFKSLYIPGSIVWQVLKKGTPLFFNEMLWASGIAAIQQNYASRGITVVAALNINSTASNLFSVIFLAMGTAISVIVGQLLGAGKIKEAKDAAIKLSVFTLFLGIVVGVAMSAASPFIPLVYNQTGVVKQTATALMLATAVVVPLQAFAHASYFVIRSGGQTFITFLFDSVFVWVLMLPLAWALSTYTALPIVPLYLICQGTEIIKCFIGGTLVSKGVWARNLVAQDSK